MSLTLGWPDRLVAALDDALRTLAAPPGAARPSPADTEPECELAPEERRASAALMRVNHAGELAAQALYAGQALGARSPQTGAQLAQAAREERDHLAWCTQRLAELGGRRSLLAPIWYAGGFALGALAGLAGDRLSFGFVAETERQVEAHLDDHLRRLPASDGKSRAVLKRMAEDERHHGTTATLAGAEVLPLFMRRAMALGGGLLRTTALRV